MRNGAMRFGMAVLVLCSLGACGRYAAPMTECVEGKPAVERVDDVAPPNCDPQLPAAAG